MGKPFSVNFDDIDDFVDNHFLTTQSQRRLLQMLGLVSLK